MIDVLKSEEGPEAVAATEERAFELEKELEKTKRKQDEVLQRLKASDKELNEARGNLYEVQKQLKEARVKARKMDDELLQSVKALESARAELPRQAIDNYRESTGFKEDLKRMAESHTNMQVEILVQLLAGCSLFVYLDSECREDHHGREYCLGFEGQVV
ncbi:hypothetical protein B296_00012869 [Ensete ventricosum]|uniref:Uncharacterized protein n=1 Tax=Ensete ventricosum TaxID=4639 RepID=A0A426Z174_ENSVE|nr:hypothetical protein B296_00012869 [Ensete ventricosum]